MKGTASILSLTASLLWLALVGKVVYDLHQFGAEMERLGRECARTQGAPYTGKTCVEWLEEERRKAST